MYERIKNLAKSILPKTFIDNHQERLRGIVALAYRGKKVSCNVCEKRFSKFIKLKNSELICPNCGSLPRTRRLLDILLKDKGLSNKQVLHFSPPKGFRNRLESLNLKEYITTDYEGEFDADKKLNIENIEEPNNKYDVIICYHVLEHIIKDQQAISELYRILKFGGFCYIQTPFKNGEIYEDYSIVSKEERLKHFGQDDHVRIYSIEGLKNRLIANQFCVEVLTFNNTSNNIHGVSEEEVVLKAVKK